MPLTAANSPDLSEIVRELHNRTFPNKNLNRASRAATLRSLAKIKRASIDLLAGLSEAHGPTIQRLSMSFTGQSFEQLKIYLQMLAIAAASSEGLDELDYCPDETSKKGAPKKSRPTYVALRTAAYFCMLTGRVPSIEVDRITSKACGPFFELVKVVFSAKGIKASPEHYGKEAGKSVRAEKEKSPEFFIHNLLVT